MTPTYTPELRTTELNVDTILTTIKQKGAYADIGTYNIPIIEIHSQKDLVAIQQEKNNVYLSIEIIQKMILRFLTETRMSKEKLAETLGVDVKSLKQLCSKNAPLALIPKINLPLIKLYCRTKF